MNSQPFPVGSDSISGRFLVHNTCDTNDTVRLGARRRLGHDRTDPTHAAGQGIYTRPPAGPRGMPIAIQMTRTSVQMTANTTV